LGEKKEKKDVESESKTGILILYLSLHEADTVALRRE
jgi:hypothetical protein